MNDFKHCFNPTFFAHGRLLHRFDGSDACRFSPKRAWKILDNLEVENAVLWDPFCGTGLIPSLAALFFRHKFSHIVVSDVLKQAMQCAYKNLCMLTQIACFEDRINWIRGRQGCNVKSLKRWKEVEVYAELIRDLIERKPVPKLTYYHSSVFELPKVSFQEKQLVFIGGQSGIDLSTIDEIFNSFFKDQNNIVFIRMIARSFLKDFSLAEDVVQNVLIALYLGLKKSASDGEINYKYFDKRYIYKTVKNHCNSIRRKKINEKINLEIFEKKNLEKSNLVDCYFTSKLEDELYENKEKLFNSLSPRQEETLKLVVQNNGKKLKEAFVDSDISFKTRKKYLYIARKRAKKWIKLNIF